MVVFDSNRDENPHVRILRALLPGELLLSHQDRDGALSKDLVSHAAEDTIRAGSE